MTPSASIIGQAPVQHPLLHLEFRNAVPEQAADPIGFLEHRHRVPGSVQLVGRREAGRTGPDDGDLLARAHGGRLRRDPAFVERPLDDRHLDPLDRHRIVVDAEHARAFARRRTEASR